MPSQLPWGLVPGRHWGWLPLHTPPPEHSPCLSPRCLLARMPARGQLFSPLSTPMPLHTATVDVFPARCPRQPSTLRHVPPVLPHILATPLTCPKWHLPPPVLSGTCPFRGWCLDTPWKEILCVEGLVTSPSAQLSLSQCICLALGCSWVWGPAPDTCPASSCPGQPLTPWCLCCAGSLPAHPAPSPISNAPCTPPGMCPRLLPGHQRPLSGPLCALSVPRPFRPLPPWLWHLCGE